MRLLEFIFVPFFRRHCSRTSDVQSHGFALIELLVVIAILVVIAGVGITAYENTLNGIKSDISERRNNTVEDVVRIEYAHIMDRRKSLLIDRTTNEPIDRNSTCRAFVEALKPKLKSFRNPYDNSPAVTFSSAGNLLQKQGKLRITCYKHLHLGNSNGAECPMSAAAIRLTHYIVPCGASCNSPFCQSTGSRCKGLHPHIWYAGMQREVFVGKLRFEKSFIPPSYRPDSTLSAKECGVPYISSDYVPLEADY